jgi:hypothetical protein
MTQQIINVGTLPNDGTGDPIREAFTKVNNNFSNLFALSSKITTVNLTNNTPDQVVFQIPVSQFGQGFFTIKTINTTNNDSQFIQINAYLNNNGTDVIFVGSNTLFNGGPLNQYNMDINSGNVRLKITPLVSNPLNVKIISQIIP